VDRVPSSVVTRTVLVRAAAVAYAATEISWPIVFTDHGTRKKHSQGAPPASGLQARMPDLFERKGTNGVRHRITFGILLLAKPEYLGQGGKRFRFYKTSIGSVRDQVDLLLRRGIR